MEGRLGGGSGSGSGARVRSGGVLALSVSQAMELFDAAVSGGGVHVVGVRWDLAELRRLAGVGELGSMLAGLVPVVRRTAAAGESVSQLVARLGGVEVAARRRLLVELVASNVAAVLGHESAAEIGESAAFKDLGLDSLGAIGVRNRLQTATGLSLPASLVFDYPNPTAVADLLLEELLPGSSVAVADSAPDPMTEVRRLLRSLTPTRSGDVALIDRLMKLAEAQQDWSDDSGDELRDRRASIRDMDIDALIDLGLGISDGKSDD